MFFVPIESKKPFYAYSAHTLTTFFIQSIRQWMACPNGKISNLLCLT